MAEPMFQRVRRMLTAKVEDAIDRMEQSGNDSVMREAIREVERVGDEIKAEHAAVMTRRLQAQRQQKTLREKAGEMTARAEFALKEGREDLAEAALSRQLDFETEAAALDKVQAEAAGMERHGVEMLAALAARKREMEEALQFFIAAGIAAQRGGEHRPRPDRARRVEQAEAAFSRALAAAGGAGFAAADASAAQRVAEIDALRKSAVVAGRLAALRQASGRA